MIILNSSLVVGISINDQQKTSISKNKLNDGYIPILMQVVITVAFDGKIDYELEDVHFVINNWTGLDERFIKMRFQIINHYNHTGSTNFFWRLAEYPDGPFGWILFWFYSGHVHLTKPQRYLSKLKINWSAGDDNIIIDYTIGFTISSDEPCKICLCMIHQPRVKAWSCFDYIPMETKLFFPVINNHIMI